MQEVFEKIKERLNTERGRYWNDNSEYGTGKWSGIDEAMDIVDQVAEEYKECALCYFGNPCEYQNKDARMPESELNNGWIPVSSGKLPKKGQVVNATILIESQQRRFVTQVMYGSWWLNSDKRMIAWKPLEEPYEGE